MKKPLQPITPPSRTELFTLRLMIVLGFCSTGYLLYCLFQRSQIAYAPFYWVLMGALTFNCLRVWHEWYHYFSITIPVRPAAERQFTVDVFTTFCPGEPYEMIENTLTAIQAIRYPHTTYLCDEANDPYLIEVCHRLGVRHISRNNRKDAKAGNINNALRYATGELCVILDPDHVPAPDFLDEIVPHFNDDAIGFVQTVQAYSNMGDSLVAKGAAQQTFQFYGPIMSCMNKYGTVLAIGANCTFRRAALDSVGGHAAGLAEDMHTAMQLHARKWKSVYVPAVLTRGLVPSTMSAYYAQQLKWARGTFELLVTAYPRLFRRFTWSQRLHYFTIPFHYFSGVVFLINFLIPMLALVTGLIPFQVDMVDFALLGLPVMASIILIRHFVQRWVMEETERGFHVVGGLLFIGTWWVHIVGLVYTIIRRKVPYIPTPKDDSGPDNWKVNLPNLVVLLASAAAIVYGLWYDWNPYSLVMASIAGLNCLIMAINIIASFRPHRMHAQFKWVSPVLVYPLLLKKQFWLFRHLRLYVMFRKLALPLLLAAMFFTGYVLTSEAEPPVPDASDSPLSRSAFYTGIYMPDATGGLTALQPVKAYQQQYKTHFDIVSLYIPWGDAPQCLLPDSLVQGIYDNGSMPMITWEPWAALFRQTDNDLQKEQKMLTHISQGFFDGYLQQFAMQVKALNRPVFLRFAHEMDNPAYPWSATGNNTPEEFRAAWIYVHRFFARHQVNNVAWVWNPWSPTAVEAYFPGEAYVDWLGVTCLNYGPQYADGRTRTFSELYQPFRLQPVFRRGLPVMIAEMGSLAAAGGQAAWLQQAFGAISEQFPEIRATVLFNSAADQNVLRPVAGNTLNWQLQEPGAVFSAKHHYPSAGSRHAHYHVIENTPEPAGPLPAHKVVPDTIRGLNYRKGENWFRNLHTLTRRDISHDLEAMKALGVNTIRRFGPGIYDRNILAVAAEQQLNIHYGFWLPAVTDMTADTDMLAGFERTVIATIARLKKHPQIKAWSLGNNTLQQLAALYHKPALIYQQKAGMQWLQQLTRKIKEADSTRPLTLDLRLTENTDALLTYLQTRLPAVDAYGLVADTGDALLPMPRTTPAPYFISQMPVKMYTQLAEKPVPAFITTWQDLETRDFVTFNGLLDHWGRYKPAYYQLATQWPHTFTQEPQLPVISILKPARSTDAGSVLPYNAIVFRNGEWRIAGHEPNVTYEWHLVKTDQHGHPLFMKKLGNGATIDVQIPDNPDFYRLYLQAVSGNSVTTAVSKLNTPLKP